MILRCLLVLLACVAAHPADSISPDTVVATINGRKITAGELDRILAGIPPKMQESLSGNRKLFVDNYALVTVLTAMAEKDGLDKVSPYKEQIVWAQRQTLMQAVITRQSERFRAEQPQDAEAAQKKLENWLSSLRQNATLKIDSESYFASPDSADAAMKVATVNGKPLTAGDIRELLTGASPQVRQNFRSNPRQFLTEYALMDSLVALAGNDKLAGTSPYREQLEWVRSNTLMQAKLNHYSDQISIGSKEEKDYYDSHLDQFTEAKVKVLYVSYAADSSPAGPPGKAKPLSEAEAKAKIEGLRKQIAGGADFVKLVKEHSEDKASASKDGDLGVFRRSDRIPEQIRDAIFGLKPGEVSQPVKQPNGFYLFRVESLATKSIEEARQQVVRDAKTAKFQEWFDSVRKSISITYDNDLYFSSPKGD